MTCWMLCGEMVPEFGVTGIPIREEYSMLFYDPFTSYAGGAQDP